MNAVYTYYDQPDMLSYSGCSNSKDLARMMALSIEYSRKQFKKIKLVTTKFGKEILVDKFKLNFDDVNTSLDEVCKYLPKSLWAYPKLYAYSIQDEPFVHIDNDVILFGNISEANLKMPLVFQNKEEMKTHLGYASMFAAYQQSGLQDHRIKDVSYACNCGVVLANNLNFIKVWHDLVKSYIFDNKEYWEKQIKQSGNNHFFEQYFSSALLHHYKIKHGFLIDNFKYGVKPKDMGTPMVHLWGEAKRKPYNVNKIAQRLYREYPKYLYIEGIKPSHSEVFDSIYINEKWGGDSGGGSRKENTVEYRKFLHGFIQENKITSIADLGIGDFQVYEDMDFIQAYPSVKLQGYDISKIVLDKVKKYTNGNISFELSDARHTKPVCDLIIIKDVMIHWSNKDVENFVNDLPKAKYILVAHDIKDATEKDIEVGSYRAFDFGKRCDKAKFIQTWGDGRKAIWLIEQ
jgi:hypothetical protein